MGVDTLLPSVMTLLVTSSETPLACYGMNELRNKRNIICCNMCTMLSYTEKKFLKILLTFTIRNQELCQRTTTDGCLGYLVHLM